MKIKAIQFNKKVLPDFVFFLPVVLLLLQASCSNDFLEIQYPSDFNEGDSLFVMSNVGTFEHEFDMQNSGTSSWRLFQYPRWLEVSPKEGIVNPGSGVKINFRVNEEEMGFGLGMFAFPLSFDVENVGLVEHTLVVFNAGHPEISNTPSVIEVDYTLQGTYQVTNSGYGILVWEVVNQPDWLILETTEGILDAHMYGIWHFTVNPEGLLPGDYSGKVEIRSNASNTRFFIEFKFTIEEKGYYGDYLTGEFIDAAYLKSLNQVVVLTKNPNNLLFFHANSPHADTLKLNRIPQCFALSEDGSTLAVGFTNAEISTYSAGSRVLLANYSAGHIPTAVEFGGENRLFFLENSDFGSFLTGLDLETGSRYKSKESKNGLSVLKKVPGKDLLLSTRPGWSPDNLFIFDISNGLVTDSVNEYWMSMSGFWLSENGERILTGSRRIYQVPAYIPGQPMSMEAPPVLGEFDITDGLTIKCIAHQSGLGKIFIACDEGWYRRTSHIIMIDYNTLVEQKAWEISTNPPFGFPQGNTWWSEIVDLFPAVAGDEFWIIHKYPAADYRDPNPWSIKRVKI